MRDIADIADIFPPLGLRVRSGPLELRGITDDVLAALADLATRGIHPPESMPFYVPWTQAPVDELPLNFVRYHWQTRAGFSPESWDLNLAVLHGGELVGVQGFSTSDYRVTRTGETGSWLGLAHQGKGIGTLMRQTLCAFLFEHLEAEEITSGAFTDNPASLAVSRKVGYRPNGVVRKTRREGEWATNQQLVLTARELVRSPYALEVDGVTPLRRLIGLDS
ncbi:GNAT family N-acetyltransferase [Nocardioides piscis]|uniref:GNAT family N-acetyltransferase n=1 Tax=Nocardioides piscis TaxID=2714938 RepID=A0A6G7YJS7_9ACTN|nr:GNAT family protein [Nocardioides piscis]QIK76976.1 GNAT family N-acetyltransferase [Nocardioides piscis]